MHNHIISHPQSSAETPGPKCENKNLDLPNPPLKPRILFSPESLGNSREHRATNPDVRARPPRKTGVEAKDSNPSHRRRTINSRDRRNRWFLRGARGSPGAEIMPYSSEEPTKGCKSACAMRVTKVAWDRANSTLNRSDQRSGIWSDTKGAGRPRGRRPKYRLSSIKHQASEAGPAARWRKGYEG